MTFVKERINEGQGINKVLFEEWKRKKALSAGTDKTSNKNNLSSCEDLRPNK
ncbi:MAG: hypothetical protein NE330_08775 [Lentisphaeraceae bacterium]|nr:hypothetical protein [Lentisphaeraceae bacterium]